jgi:hypothetical protein
MGKMKLKTIAVVKPVIAQIDVMRPEFQRQSSVETVPTAIPQKDLFASAAAANGLWRAATDF